MKTKHEKNHEKMADCPGTESEMAGKSSACEGCPNQVLCATAPKGPDPGRIDRHFKLKEGLNTEKKKKKKISR